MKRDGCALQPGGGRRAAADQALHRYSLRGQFGGVNLAADPLTTCEYFLCRSVQHSLYRDARIFLRSIVHQSSFEGSIDKLVDTIGAIERILADALHQLRSPDEQTALWTAE